MAMDFVLMSLGCALEPENSRILMKIGESESLYPKDLAKQLGMTELTVRERINALFQSGFVSRNYESGTNSLTEAGQSLVSMLNQIVDLLVVIINEKLPDLVSKGDEPRL
jgi:DNA-binding MarR family transcriptional regulator